MSKMKSERKGGQVLEKGDRRELSVAFPVESEVISTPAYTLKIEALADTKRVEVSINGEAWLPCREALGSWWYDWKGYKAGDYEARARVTNEKGETEMSPRRHFSVMSEGWTS